MIADTPRAQFLANLGAFAGPPCVALAAIAGDAIDEPEVLDGWALLRQELNGAGARIGYRAFLAVLHNSEAELHAVVDAFCSQRPVNAAWRFVAATISKTEETVAVIQEIEWRAHKAVQYQTSPALKFIEVSGAL